MAEHATETLRKPRSRWHRLWVLFVVMVNLAVTAGMLFSAYCGTVAPSSWSPAVVITMTFPAWLAAAALLFVLDLVWWRRTALVPGLGMLLCMSAVNAFCPLNFPRGEMSDEQRARSFTLMSYNMYLMRDQEEEAAGGSNRELDYIIERSPDIVCVQEALELAKTPSNKITDHQLDTLGQIYPYIYINGEDLAFMSKYPAEPVDIGYPAGRFRNGVVGCWRVHIDGRVLNVFNVHLRSLFFTQEDRTVFREATSIDSVNSVTLGEVRHDLMPKLVEAALEREEQIKLLSGYIRKYGGENAVVCGDFNDPVGCYGLHYLSEHDHMRQAYAETGFGPMITYNANHFYFRIDHILYRGAFKPYSMSRGDIKASDHYPLEAVFVRE